MLARVAVLCVLLLTTLLLVGAGRSDIIVVAPDDLGISVGNALEYRGDPNQCSFDQLPSPPYGGCEEVALDCQMFRILNSCEASSLADPDTLAADDPAWWLQQQLGSCWEVDSIADFTPDSDWDCLFLIACE